MVFLIEIDNKIERYLNRCLSVCIAEKDHFVVVTGSSLQNGVVSLCQ